MPLIFIGLLVGHADFVLISLFYADFTVAYSRLSQLSSHCCVNTVRTANSVLEDWQ